MGTAPARFKIDTSISAEAAFDALTKAVEALEEPDTFDATIDAAVFAAISDFRRTVRREWEAGDVAMVECSDGGWRRAMYTDGYAVPSWVFCDGLLRRADDSAARPLVLLDPKDRESVERLYRLYYGGKPEGQPVQRLLDAFQAALREYADPKPIKPPEPTGLGAVVEDAMGRRWSRTDSADFLAAWLRDGTDSFENYSAIDAVHILSDGVSADA